MNSCDSKYCGIAMAIAVSCSSALAAENGLTRTLTGGSGYEMTLPMFPGLYVDVWAMDYRASKLMDNTGHAASGQVTIPGLGPVPLTLRSKTTVDLVIPRLNWLTEKIIGEGRLGFGLALPAARVDHRLDFSSIVPALASALDAQSASASGKNSGQGDIEATTFLDWQNDSGRLSAGLSFGIPTGNYDKNRGANAGFGNFWTIRPAMIASHIFGNGAQIGAFTSLNFNTRNRDTQYRSGSYFQSDLMAMYPMGESWRVGLQGYVLKQFTDDSDAAGKVAGNRTQAFGLGPSIAFISEGDWGVDFKVMPEFGVRNRTQGVVSWLRLHVRLD